MELPATGFQPPALKSRETPLSVWIIGREVGAPLT
jgi:hypothetical protein